MCQMCDEYEAELRRMGIAMDEKVTVDFDRETMDGLRRQAEAHGHDVETEVREIVRGTIPTAAPVADWVARAKAIRGMTSPGSIKVDSVRLIRASRDFDH